MTATYPLDAVPQLTVAQMIEVDRLMVEEIGIDLPQMMENAGRALAGLVIERHGPGRVALLAGPGGNGGGGLVAARHLSNRGVAVTVTLDGPPGALHPVTGRQFRILEAMGVCTDAQPATGVDVVVDALLGYSGRGAPRGRTAELAAWASGQDAPVVSLDSPTGLDLATGEMHPPAVHADATLTLALPKEHLAGAEATGRLFLADLSVPTVVWVRLGIDVPGIFSREQIVELVPTTEEVLLGIDTPGVAPPGVPGRRPAGHPPLSRPVLGGRGSRPHRADRRPDSTD